MPAMHDTRASIVAALGARSLVLVGMMGAGKTVMGRRLAEHLKIEFLDTDCEIESAAGMTIPEIFERHGETYFRDREGRVVERLIGGGPRIVATGGGAFANTSTRATIKSRAVSLWIKADFDVLMRRVRKRGNRPLLKTADPEKTLQDLMALRYPLYAEADMMVVSRDGPHEVLIAEMLSVIESYLCPSRERSMATRNR
jgi:shikimate kinase